MPTSIKAISKLLRLILLRFCPGISPAGIFAKFGLRKPTAFPIVSELIDARVISEAGAPRRLSSVFYPPSGQKGDGQWHYSGRVPLAS